MAKTISSDRYLREVAAAAIRMVKLEQADHELLNDFKPGAMYANVNGSPRIEQHQRLWKRITKARADLKAAAMQTPVAEPEPSGHWSDDLD